MGEEGGREEQARRFVRLRLHLSHKAEEAEAFFSRQKVALRASALGVGRGVASAVVRANDVGDVLTNVVRKHAELAALSGIGLLALRPLGMRARLATVAAVTAGWVIWAPEVTSSLAKASLQCVNDRFN